MRLRPTSEYIEAVRAVLPISEDGAQDYATIAQQTAGRLGLTQADLQATRPMGRRRRSEHRSTLSAVLFQMKDRGQVRAGAGRRNRRYWLPQQARYAGATRNPTHEEIAKRAFEIYASRGYTHGCHEQDWLQAERELLGG